ncbi:MAG: valine--tRNA ligase [Deltaproteobacteria bacterium]|nr:valine--tRNA ligase [Deltaproteobacteria bacterium]
MSTEMPKAYDPKDVEPRWYAFWIENNAFRADPSPDDKRPVYVIPMPPPNVTGALHMGHALMTTIEDVLLRHKRMQGFNTLYQPGIDHAGIATQTVVERILRAEGKSRHDLGRPAFLERIWQWKAKSGGRINDQQRVLGASADWPRLKFTMDPDMTRAVREAFVRLHDEGLIYRATRLINWCSDCRTALSDLEVENEEGAQGEMFQFAYPISQADGGGEIVVATTRPETMLGDTAVAVHPDDPRYKHLHGKRLRHPILDREIPIITDSILVDPKFGTGAVKVTPAHDFNDFATGKRHKLEEINILELDGKLNANAGKFAGMTVKESRKAVKKELEALGLTRGTQKHALSLPRCQRCETVVEPMISTQWFVQMKPLAEPALQAVNDGRTVIIPAEWKKTYDHFLENIQDWCISRQLWWGHQIPAWYCGACGEVTVSRDDTVDKCSKCGSDKMRQDDDVLDTWFSSALWPFSTLGWPDQTDFLKKFYPASDMETGYDILFFWVARMMMMGLHFMGEVPFRRVLLHGLVVDENGDKMSKVKGNVIDPLDLIYGASFDQVVAKALPGAPPGDALTRFKKAYPSASQLGTGFPAFGADAVRFTLCSYSPQAKRIALAPKRIEGYRNFCNKIWNAVRYSMTYIEAVAVTEAPPPATALANRWILSRLISAVEASTKGIDEFRLDDASGALYHFFWDELCSWYLELTKPVFLAGSEELKNETRAVLAHAIQVAVRALHPFIPFISEELWHRVPRAVGMPDTVSLARYPTAIDGRLDAAAEADMQIVQNVIVAARTIRAEHEVHPGAEIPLLLRAADPSVRELLAREMVSIRTLVKTQGDPQIEPAGSPRPRGSVMSVAGPVEVLVGLSGLVEGAREKERVQREIKKVEKDIVVTDKKLSSPSFVDKAPAEVVAETRTNLEALRRKRTQLDEALAIADELG